MATITARDGRFTVRVRRNGFKPASKTFTRRLDATAWGRRVEADMEGGRWVDASATTTVTTVRDALATYRTAVVANLKGAATYAYWLDELEASTLAPLAVAEVTPFALAEWRDAQAAKHSAGTVARKLGLLSGFLSWCQKERGWIASNPMASVRKPKVDDARDRTLSDDESSYLLAACWTSRASWLADVLVVLMRSAMRRGELFGLRREAIDFDRSVAHLSDTKNGSDRDVPLCTLSREALQRLADAAKDRGDRNLVPVAAAGAMSLAFRRTLARARQDYEQDCARASSEPAAGFLIDVRVHDLRHCAVTTWASTGALSLVELMAVSGHKTPKMLARYAHLDASKLAGKLSSLTAR